MREEIHANQPTKDTLVRANAQPQSIKGSIQVGRESSQTQAQGEAATFFPCLMMFGWAWYRQREENRCLRSQWSDRKISKKGVSLT